VGDVAGCHDELRRSVLDECAKSRLDVRLVVRAGVEIRDVEQTRHPPEQAIDS
jgi:hypothetical protein